MPIRLLRLYLYCAGRASEIPGISWIDLRDIVDEYSLQEDNKARLRRAAGLCAPQRYFPALATPVGFPRSVNDSRMTSPAFTTIGFSFVTALPSFMTSTFTS